MSMQPFLISESKTGLFNYLEPWISPLDAFSQLINAYVYRAKIFKRNGYTFFGRMSYQDTIAVGNGGKTYSGTLITHPIVAGSFTPTDGIETFTDNGLGVLTGSLTGSGTINYTTGAWTLTFFNNVSAGPPPVAILGIYSPNVTPAKPIMGLKLWSDETNGQKTMVSFDTRRMSYFDTTSQMYKPVASVSQVIWVGDNSTTMITLNTGWTAVSPYTNVLAPFSISITDGTDTIIDNGSGGLSTAGNFAAGGTVSYSTGVIVLNFTAATLTATLTGGYFSGDGTNFFNAINWLGNLFITNNVDPITLYNGSTLSRPYFSITQANQIAGINNIQTCLDVDVYKNRLLVQRPTVINAGGQNGIGGQSIRYSALQNPTNLVADVTGNGGELSAPTDDFMQSSEFLRDQLVVFFQNSAWTFRFTGSAFDPFRWDKINSTKSTNAPYGTIPYDERITAMGAQGLIACDGVNVQRYDVSVIDLFLDINQNHFPQCYGARFDTLNQSWMLYPSTENNSSTSDSAIIYNFLENTWSTYSIAMSCLGIGFITVDAIWNDFAVGQPLGNTYPNWNAAEIPWNNFVLQDLAPQLLGGGLDGIIYQMNEGNTDNGSSISCSITTSKWNPFSGSGQKVQFGWIDFYYTIDPLSPPATLTLNFFTDNSSIVVATRTLTLDGASNSGFAWKRIYINNIGEFLQMNISSSDEATFEILGMILWAKPSGRMTP